MKNAFIVSFKLKNTYRVNSIIYSIKQIPIINKLMRNNLYGNRDLKLFGNIISAIREIGGIFLGKLIYILIMITYVLDFYETNKGDTFIHMFIFLTLVGGLLNTFMFNPTKDKYYAMFIMNMDAKKYTLANYYYTLLKTFIGFLPFTIIFGLMAKLPLLICVLLSMFVIIIKLIVSSYGLLSFEKSNKVRNENFPGKITWISVAILLLIAYGTPLLGITINKIIFMILER